MNRLIALSFLTGVDYYWLSHDCESQVNRKCLGLKLTLFFEPFLQEMQIAFYVQIPG